MVKEVIEIHPAEAKDMAEEEWAEIDVAAWDTAKTFMNKIFLGTLTTLMKPRRQHQTRNKQQAHS